MGRDGRPALVASDRPGRAWHAGFEHLDDGVVADAWGLGGRADQLAHRGRAQVTHQPRQAQLHAALGRRGPDRLRRRGQLRGQSPGPLGRRRAVEQRVHGLLRPGAGRCRPGDRPGALGRDEVHPQRAAEVFGQAALDRVTGGAHPGVADATTRQRRRRDQAGRHVA